MAQKYADATGGELERKEYGWRVHEPIKESGDGLLGEVGFKDFDVARMSGKNSGGESSGDSGQGGGWFSAANGGLAVGELARQGKIYEIYGRSAQSVENALSNGQYVHTNGKTYRQGFRGNQYVSSKSVSNSLSTAKLAKNIGRGITGLSVGISLYQFGTSKQTEADYARLAAAAFITGAAFIPAVGPFISIGLGVADSLGAFDQIYNSFDR
jgi:hypothetical protein